MSGLLAQIENSIRARKLFSRGQKILVAVSGGVDSMVLLHALHRLAPENRWQLIVAHFNHQLRGRSSDADERLVGATAKKLGLPFVAGRGDVRQFAASEKLSVEMAARELRHDFLACTARRRKISTVALAHHADDQVELFFLRLLRGSGGEGLAGMKWRSPSPANVRSSAFTRSGGRLKAGLQTELIRPLLDVSKVELEKFARENRIAFREDASNQSPDFLRNRIRGELLPLLRKNYSPSVDKTVLRTMEIIGAEAEFVVDAACSAGKSFFRMPVAVQRRVLQRRLAEQGIAPEFDLIERLRMNPGAVVAVDAQRGVSRDAAGKILVRRSAPPKFRDRVGKLELGAAGSEHFGRLTFSWSVARQKSFRRPKPAAGREFFDADAVGGKIVLRHWRAGDRFRPIGMAAAVKLQDLFVNAKIPRARRRELVVATTVGGEIFWVEGLRLGENFKLSAATKRRLHWKWAEAC